MSGHSKWSTIKRKKGAADAKRGQVFTRITREIVMASREGGGDPEGNFSLRLAIDKARAVNMPKENIERAIKRGSGDSKEGEVYSEISYEGYAPCGVALIVQCVTENKNRTVAEVRHILTRLGGSLGETGSVTWQFTRIAYFSLPLGKHNFDKVFELAVEAGADDVTEDGESIEVFAPVEAFKILSDAFHKAKFTIDEAELRMQPNQEMELDVEDTLRVMHVIEELEDLDDVQTVYSNLHISEEAMSALESA